MPRATYSFDVRSCRSDEPDDRQTASRVDRGTGTTNNAAEQASQLFSQLDAGANVLGDATALKDTTLSAGQGRPASQLP